MSAFGPRPPPGPARKGDWSFIVVPDGHQAVRRIKLSRQLRARLLMVGLLGLALSQWAFVEVAYWRAQAARLPRIAAEAASLKRRMGGVQRELSQLEEALGRMEATTARVQAITQLNDPERNLRLGPLADDGARPGPVLYARGERIESEDELLSGRAGMLVLDHALSHAKDVARAAESQQSSVLGFLAGHEGLINATPSIYPLASHLVTSPFGPRVDVFTGHEVLHKGVDILADVGSPVWAPADGRVIYVGMRGEGYGEVVVIDHGFGVQTHYAHVANVQAAPGDWLTRGKRFAEVGHTGRTTGVYLHYEVRFNGLPEDPARFFLDEPES